MSQHLAVARVVVVAAALGFALAAAALAAVAVVVMVSRSTIAQHPGFRRSLSCHQHSKETNLSAEGTRMSSQRIRGIHQETSRCPLANVTSLQWMYSSRCEVRLCPGSDGSGLFR